ncbi:gamma-glutamyltranspeptidase / glutathione hydrolase [Algoriphagus alkaliphilus]|uniref:Glutathione hydrolase proenzyme n=1 Tax=Algoriphagus alkaliphilus TaxID=279824 RepID=A0A1G5VD92_9BACT|nr:gamma-glutamyltransferase [Algoriphagus alkaliphilus]MBA4299732.1 gamma-glutamyltransferase [Cyclobacterium sp.]SDA43754.1 gamma-glutamyltranspeptidase / glutathione hydrolase [Algoriphagus alkaliphilus]
MKALSLLLAGILIPLLSFSQDRVTGKTFTTRSEILAQNGMAATSQPLATQVALDILKKGGSAMDAAIAANAMLGLVEPNACGIGGDVFAIIWDAKTKKLYGFNGSGRAPESLTMEVFKEKGLSYVPLLGPLPVTVPGCVDGWFEMHKRFGKLTMQEILQPSIDYGNSGFPVSEVIAWQMNGHWPEMQDIPGFRKTYMPNGKTTPQKGEVFKNPDLARIYALIAKEGRSAFYEGEIARIIDRFMKENGGYLRYEDLKKHTSEWVDPISTNYRGYDVWELPPNGQGIAVLQMLNILEGYDIKSMGFGSAEYLHVLTEAKKLAFEDRAKFYADPAFNEIPVELLISKEYAAERRKLIDPNKAALSYPAGDIEKGNTTYLTVADKDGNMVSFIQSIYDEFGSGMVPDGLGFVLQNRGQQFNVQDTNHWNSLAKGKRPFHTIIPAFITKDGGPWLSFGLMGGSVQPQGHTQIVVNLIDFGMNFQEAGDAPRMRHNGSSEPTGSQMTTGGSLNLESGFSYEVIRQLEEMGHRIEYSIGPYGGYQAIFYDKARKVYIGASESRKDGQAAGY